MPMEKCCVFLFLLNTIYSLFVHFSVHTAKHSSPKNYRMYRRKVLKIILKEFVRTL